MALHMAAATLLPPFLPFEMINSIFKKANESNIKCNFQIVDVEKKDMIKKSTIKYLSHNLDLED